MKLISFFDVPSTMRLEGDSSVCLEIAFLYMTFSATMIRDVLLFIFVRPPRSVIAWSSHCFLTGPHLLSALLTFSHHYPLHVVWKDLPILFRLMGFPDVSDPVLTTCTNVALPGVIKDRVVLLGVVRDRAVLVCIGSGSILWQISSRPRKIPSAFLVSVVYCYLFGCSCFFRTSLYVLASVFFVAVIFLVQ